MMRASGRARGFRVWDLTDTSSLVCAHAPRAGVRWWLVYFRVLDHGALIERVLPLRRRSAAHLFSLMPHTVAN